MAQQWPSSVVVCTPSRGLIHSRTIEAVQTALQIADDAAMVLGWLISHDLPIPDAHETLAARGLDSTAEYLWFVEEDMLPPAEALRALLTTARLWGAGVVTLDYPVGEQPTRSAVTWHPDGSVWWCGLGCTLISRAALARIPRPWFDTSRLHIFTQPGVLTTLDNQPYPYGGQDVSFCLAARAAGIRIACVPGLRAGHARLRSLGAAQTNHGAHTIDVLTAIET
jgi:hypothetical protein